MKREIKFRAVDEFTDDFIYAPAFFIDKDNNQGYLAYGIDNHHCVKKQTVGQFTGYQMFKTDVYFGDLVSNNFKTDKEVIREIVLHEGTIMMKRVKGNSTLPKYINLHEWHNMNFKVIGNIHENPELL